MVRSKIKQPDPKFYGGYRFKCAEPENHCGYLIENEQGEFCRKNSECYKRYDPTVKIR